MSIPADSVPPYDQASFHRRWGHLCDMHVRDLAWLLDAPEMLDAQAPQWRGQVAKLRVAERPEVAAWLAALDRDPDKLHVWLRANPQQRLGRYAEQLMAFYFDHWKLLYAHGLQVRAGSHKTIGEFDFLLEEGAALVHWEFATKFYLLAGNDAQPEGVQGADYFLGPNLADSLGAKMRKILDRQLRLASHPAAHASLPRPVESAQALVKGWLFYPKGATPDSRASGLTADHCRGSWCTLSSLQQVQAQRYCVLPRLSWLAPASREKADAVEGAHLPELLEQIWAKDCTPILVAQLQEVEDRWLEQSRMFIVPDDWRERAENSLRPGSLHENAVKANQA